MTDDRAEGRVWALLEEARALEEEYRRAKAQ